MQESINWKTFFVLLGACVITSLFVIPYQLALVPEAAQMGAMIYLLALVQALIIFSISVFFGLFLAQKVGFEVVKGEISSFLKPSLFWGVLSGIFIVGADLFFQSVDISLIQEAIHAPIWAAILASFYGGIAEEVLMRLFVMTLFVWIISKLTKKVSDWGVWTAIILSSVLFGLGHLPITSALTDITFIVVLRAIVLNGIGGVIFGWLYWKRGLLSAMIAHFSADIVLHVITPIVVKMLM